MRRLGAVLSSYTIRAVAGPTVFALVGLSVMLLAKDLLGFADFVINRGFGVLVVAMIAFYEILPLAARVLPFAVLVGVLVGLGRLQGDREIVALEASGVSSQRLVGPVLLFATAMATLGIVLSLFAAPWATRSLMATLRLMAAQNPGLSLRAGTVHEFQDVKLAAREISASGKQLRGVLVWVPEQGQTLFAERGELQSAQEGGMQLILRDGVMLRTPRVSGEDTRFERFFQPLHEGTEKIRKHEDVLSEVSLADLAALAWGEANVHEPALRAQTEFHRRVAYPLAGLCFGLLAVPLAFSGRRFSRAAGGVTGLLVTLLYYGLLQLGDGLSQAGMLSVSGGVWLPNLVVLVLAGALLMGERWWPRWTSMRRRHRSDVPPEARWQPRLLASQKWLSQRWILWRYVGRQYLVLWAFSFAVLFVGYLLVDILERLDWFARHQADLLQALQFYGFRTPLLASRVVPMSLLLATTLTVSALSSRLELVGMRACGVSAVYALLPMIGVAALVTPGYFLLNEFVVPETNTLADQFKNLEIKNRAQDSGPLQQLIWYRAGSYVYQAAQFDPQRGQAVGLSVYTLGNDGLPVERIDAAEAKHVGGGMWELSDPARVTISDRGVQEMPAETRIQLGEAPEESVDTMQFGVGDLARYIRDTEVHGYDATGYRVDFHVKLAAPLACILLPAIAMFFSIAGPPFPPPAVTLLVTTVVGVGQVLLTGVCASLGYGGFLPPSIAGWLPSVGFVCVAGALARRSLG
ncbi:MAG: LptF/LptG family permease [Deltaproteobacteria bacterium]|nr:LptF/LptG family permease [Deltaproteobacteria bacterium]